MKDFTSGIKILKNTEGNKSFETSKKNYYFFTLEVPEIYENH